MKRFLESVGLLSSKRPRIDEPSQDILQGEKETEEESKVEEVEEENEIQEPLEGYDDIEEDLEEPDESDGGIELDYQILHDDDEDEDYQPEKTPEMSDSDDGRAGGIALAHKSSSPIPGSPELGPEYASPPKKRKARAKTDIVEDDMIVDDSQESAAIDSSDSEDVELRDEGAESVKADSELASPQPEDDQDYLELSYKPKKIGQIPLSHLKWTLQQMIDSSNNDLTEQILAREGIGCTGQKFLWPFPLSWKYFQEILDSSDYTFNSDYQDTSILYVDQGEDFTSDDEIVESDGEIDSDFSERSVDFDITNPKSKSLFEFVSIGTLKAKGYLEGKQKSSQYNDGRESENHKDGTASKKTIAQGAPWSKFIEAVPLYEYPTLFWNSNPSDEHSFTDDVELGRAFNAMIKSDILKTLPRHRQILSTYTRSIVSSESTRSLGKIWDVLYMIHSKQSVKKNNPSFIRSKSKHMDWVTVLQAAVMIDMPEDAKIIDGIHTEVMVISFANAVVTIITQLDNLATIMHSAISQIRGYDLNISDDSDVSLPVQTHLLLGSSGDKAWPLYQVYAAEISKIRHKKRPDDERPTIIGVSLKGANQIDFVNSPPSLLTKQRAVMNAITKMVENCPIC